MRIITLVAIAALAGGCASITRGWTTQLHFHSEPPGALVRTSMGHQCVTPCSLQFSRKDEFDAVFSLPGYVAQQIPVRTRLAGAGAAGVAGNVILGGVVGMGVDVASGAALEHCPSPVVARMQRAAPQGRSPAGAPGEAPFAIVDPPECAGAAVVTRAEPEAQ